MADAVNVVMNEATSRFEVTLGDETAFAEYRLKGDHITLPHTVVPDSFAGKGVGGALARAALGYARDHHLLVKPSCSFMAAYIVKHPEDHDLVHPDFRKALGL